MLVGLAKILASPVLAEVLQASVQAYGGKSLVSLAHFNPLSCSWKTAAWLVQAGVPITEVRDVLGHGSVVMTERYAHLAPDNVRKAVAVLDGGEVSVSRFGHGGVGKGKQSIAK